MPSRSGWAIIISFIIILIIFLILGFSVTSYDSQKESSTMLRFGMLISIIFISSLSNILSHLYINFLNSSMDSNSTSKVSIFKNSMC